MADYGVLARKILDRSRTVQQDANKYKKGIAKNRAKAQAQAHVKPRYTKPYFPSPRVIYTKPHFPGGVSKTLTPRPGSELISKFRPRGEPLPNKPDAQGRVSQIARYAPPVKKLM